MKLRMGFLIIDFVERFCVIESIVVNIFFIWINYLYVIFGSFKIWFYRDIILNNLFVEFLEKYLNNIVIIDVIEFKI